MLAHRKATGLMLTDPDAVRGSFLGSKSTAGPRFGGFRHFSHPKGTAPDRIAQRENQFRVREVTVTVKEAAMALGLTVRQVQADIRSGCDGIVRLGSPGPGNSALLDLEVYCAWRAQRGRGVPPEIEQERERGFELLLECAWVTLVEHGGIVRQNRERAAEMLAGLILRYYPALFRRNLDRIPPQLRSLLRVCVPSDQLPEADNDE